MVVEVDACVTTGEVDGLPADAVHSRPRLAAAALLAHAGGGEGAAGGGEVLRGDEDIDVGERTLDRPGLETGDGGTLGDSERDPGRRRLSR